MIVLTAAYAVWLGIGRALRYFAVGIFSAMLAYRTHAGILLTYRQPDNAEELAIYVQTTPDVTRVVKELQDFSEPHDRRQQRQSHLRQRSIVADGMVPARLPEQTVHRCEPAYSWS